MNPIRNTMMTLAMVTLTVGTAFADAPRNTASKEESIGLGGGVVVGALAGGPFGALVGGALGAVLGDRMHRDGETRRSLEADLSAEEARSRKLDARLSALHEDLAQRDALLAEVSTKIERIGEVLQFSVLFRTGEAELDAASAQRLQRLGQTLADLHGVEIWIEGYADPRGDEEFNRSLSSARAESVRRVLEQSGLRAQSISAVAHGASESTATDGDLDAYALERRVDIRLMLDDTAERVAGKR